MKMYRNSLNLFDKDNTEQGWISASGEILVATYGAMFTFTLSEQTEITINATGTPPYSYEIAWYDTSDNFISRSFFSAGNVDHPNTAKVPTNAAKATFVVSCSSASSAVITQEMLDSYLIILSYGQIIIPYEPYNVVDWYTTGYSKYSNGAWGAATADKKYSGGEWG